MIFERRRPSIGPETPACSPRGLQKKDWFHSEGLPTVQEGIHARQRRALSVSLAIVAIGVASACGSSDSGSNQTGEMNSEIAAVCGVTSADPQVPTGDAPAEALGIAPDAELQARLERLAAMEHEESASPEKVCAAIEELRNRADQDQHEFFKQLLYLYARHAGPGGDEELQNVAMLLGSKLGIPRATMVAVLIPYIDHDHPRVRHMARNFLGKIEGGATEEVCGRRDYRWYEPLISRGDPPLPLVRYMYEHGPGSALLVLNRVHLVGTPSSTSPEWKRYQRILWAEHVVSNNLWKQEHQFIGEDEVEPAAAAELEKLSRHEAWWARLYVAEILAQHPEFRTDEVVARLKDDRHELVRLAITRPEREDAQETR